MNEERILTLLQAPHISEKATKVKAENSQYVFRVAKEATKPEIKVAVEKLFSVNVDSVRISNVKGKTKRTGRTIGRRQGWKKAYVALAAGQQIDISTAE